MVIYKNDILCRKHDGVLLPICWISNMHKDKHIDDYGFKECGIGKYYLSDYNESDSREIVCFNIKDMLLVWNFDKQETNAAKLKDNNLYLIDQMTVKWNMNDIVGYTDTSVAVSQISSDTFSFVTFNGLRFTIKVEDEEVKCIKKEITK